MKEMQKVVIELKENYPNLTGIQNSQVKHAPKLQEALTYMFDWIGDREYQVYAWSDSDYAQLQHEMISKDIGDEKLQEFMNPEYHLIYQEKYAEADSQPLNTCLGDLFAGLNFQFA